MAAFGESRRGSGHVLTARFDQLGHPLCVAANNDTPDYASAESNETDGQRCGDIYEPALGNQNFAEIRSSLLKL
jgi:hypothetical protein